MMHKLWVAAAGHVKRLLPERRAASAVLLAASIVPLIGFVGMGVDGAKAYLAKARLSQALDAAALAGGKVMFSENRAADIQKYFEANFPSGFMGTTIDGPTVTEGPNGETLELNATVNVPMDFMNLLGFDSIAISGQSVVKRQARGMELVLVMDNTGSMRSGGKMDAMKTAASALIDILYAGRESIPNFWVGLVPYAVAVNIGNQHSDWINGLDPTAYLPTTWKGCVEARATPLDMSDAPPSVGKWTPFFYPSASDNQWPAVKEENYWQNNGTGPNLGCGPAITPLLTDYTDVQAAIAEMLPWHRGGTMGNLGLAWGWRVLSPQWRGLWGGATPPTLPKDYNDPLVDKVVVMLTDGVNQWYDHPPSGPDGSDYGAYGRLGWGVLGTTNKSLATAEINDRMAQVCAAMKGQGIEIYTITFKLSNTTTQNLYRDCATSPDHYFNSPSNEDLHLVFEAIGTQLTNLHLSK